MASESTPPPPPGGGAKYAVFGIALLALAGVGYCLTQQDGTPPPTTTSAGGPDAAVLQRSTSLQDEILEIPEEEPDAWSEIPDAGLRRERHDPGPVLGSWDCTGEVDRAAAQAVIAEHRPQIQGCYERRLKQQQFLQGNVTVQLRIAQGGNVDAVQVGGSLRDREVFSCIRNVASRMRFSRVSNGHCAVLSAPFAFTPQQ